MTLLFKAVFALGDEMQRAREQEATPDELQADLSEEETDGRT
jgi:hypothetical protein